MARVKRCTDANDKVTVGPRRPRPASLPSTSSQQQVASHFTQERKRWRAQCHRRLVLCHPRLFSKCIESCRGTPAKLRPLPQVVALQRAARVVRASNSKRHQNRQPVPKERPARLPLRICIQQRDLRSGPREINKVAPSNQRTASFEANKPRDDKGNPKNHVHQKSAK